MPKKKSPPKQAKPKKVTPKPVTAEFDVDESAIQVKLDEIMNKLLELKSQLNDIEEKIS